MRAAVVLFLFTLPVAAQSHSIEVAGGYNYQYSDQGKGTFLNLNGWYVSGQFDISKSVAVSLEMDNYYGTFRGQSMLQQNFIVGPQFTLGNEEAKVRPFAYIQIGDQRSSSAGEVDHAFDLQAGSGLEIKLSDRLSLQITPGEYNFALPNGVVTNSYSAKAGLSWTVWKAHAD